MGMEGRDDYTDRALRIPYFLMYIKMPGRFFNSMGGELGRLVDQHKKITKSKQNLLEGDSMQKRMQKEKEKQAKTGRCEQTRMLLNLPYGSNFVNC